MVAPVVAGLAIGAKILSAAKKLRKLQKAVTKVQGKTKQAVNNKPPRPPAKQKKLNKLMKEIHQTAGSVGKGNTRKVMNKAADIKRKTTAGKNKAQKNK